MATIAISFASLSGVRSAAIAVMDAVSHGSREWLAADVTANLDGPPNPDQLGRLAQLRTRGIEWTLVTSAMSTAAAETSPDPGFIVVKAVDPAKYPFYGTVSLEPRQPLREALAPDAAVVSEEVSSRLTVRAGDHIRIGAGFYRIAGVMRSEPDRLAGMCAAGMCAILSPEGYARSGIARGGSSEFYRILLRLPSGYSVDSVAGDLETWFPNAAILDYRNANPQIVWAIGTALSLLNLPAFMALVVGACGIAIAVRAHVEQRIEMAAVLRVLGGRSIQMWVIFGLQILAMLTLGICLGIPLAWIAKSSVLAFGRRFAPLPAVGFSVAEIATGVCAALLAILPAIARATALLRHLRPAVVLRRNTEERTPEPAAVPRIAKTAATLAVGGFVAMGVIMLRSWDSILMLAGALAATTALVWLGAGFSLRMLRGLTSSPLLPGAVRYGLGNLYRPASRSRALIVALGSGLSTIVGTFETHRPVAHAIVESLPFDHANLLVAALDDVQSRALPATLRALPGAEGEPEMLNLARMRLGRVDGVDFRHLQTGGRILPHDWLTGCETGPPRGPSTPSGVIVSSAFAKLTGAKVGSSIELQGGSGLIHLNVVAVRGFDPMQEIWHSVTLNCAALEGENIFHDAAIRIRPDQTDAAARALHDRYPALAVITAQDLAATVSELARQTEGLVRLLAWYTLAAGVSVLIAMVSASRAARRDEIAALRALGAGRAWIFQAHLAEYAVIGLLAGLAGGLLTGGFESFLLSIIFRSPEVVFQPGVVSVSILATAAAVAGIAWLPLHPLLKQTPMEMLRRLKDV